MELLAAERAQRLLREAEAERRALPLIQARRAARRRRLRAGIGWLATSAAALVPFVPRRATREEA